MSPPTNTSSLSTKPSRSEKLKGRIVGATGVLVVLPALLNAAYDIYAAALKLPRSENEKVNVELFKKHFGTAPEKEFELGIKNQYGTVDAKFKIYREGDILVQYGEHTQWFKFPKPETAPPLKVNWFPLSAAYAAEAEAASTSKTTVEIKGNVPLAASSIKVQMGDISLRAGTITQAVAVNSGSNAQVRVQVIDIRSGMVLNTKIKPGSLSSVGARSGVTTSVDLGTVSVN